MKRISLTRTRGETLVWSVRAAAAYRPPARPKKRTAEPAHHRISLTRTPQDTFRWMIRGTPWGALTIVAAAASVLAAAVALWMTVPLIDSFVATTRASASDVIGWMLDQIAAFPTWLGSLF